MQNQLALSDIVDFIKLNRNEKVFTNYSDSDLAECLAVAIIKNTIIVDVWDNKICGLGVGELKDNNSLYIEQLIAIDKFSLRRIIHSFLIRFNWVKKITALRNNKLVEYKDIPKLLRRLYGTT